MTSGEFKMGPKDWGASAEAYAQLREPLTLPYGLDTLAAVGAGLGVRLLDLAAGTGAVALAAALQGSEVVAVDWSPSMVAYLAARANRDGGNRVSARVMDGQNLDLPSESFDAAISVFGVMFFPDHRAGLSELMRVVKPGGRVAVTVWATPTKMGHLDLWERAARTLIADGADADACSIPRPAAWLQMDSPEGLEREMEAVGFREVSVLPVSHRWEVPSAQWFIERFDGSATFRERLGPGSQERMRETVLRWLQEEFQDGPFSLTSHAHIGVATR